MEMVLHTAALRLMGLLHEHNILYCHWKSNQHVCDAMTSIDDLDILVSAHDAEKLLGLLPEAGYKRFLLPENRRYEGIEDFLGYDADTGRFSHLHLHYRLTLGEKHLKGFQLPFEAFILRRRVWDSENQIYIASHEDELFLLVIRQAMKLRTRDYIKKAVGRELFGLSTNREFIWLKERFQLQTLRAIGRSMCSCRIVDQVEQIITDGLSLHGLKRLRKVIYDDLNIFRTYKQPSSVWHQWKREAFRIKQVLHDHIYAGPKAYRRKILTGGKIIAFLGPDGAGKSTLLRNLNAIFRPVMDTQVAYLGSGDGRSSLIRKPMKAIYKILLKRGVLNRKSKVIQSDFSTQRQGDGKNGERVRNAFLPIWVWALTREREKKLRRVWRFRSHGYLVLTDRYPQNELPNICDGPRIGCQENNGGQDEIKGLRKWISKKESAFFQKAAMAAPDAVVVLEVSPECALERKPDEVDLSSHKNLMRSILSISFSDRTEHIVINADQPLEAVTLEAAQKVWSFI